MANRVIQMKAPRIYIKRVIIILIFTFVFTLPVYASGFVPTISPSVILVERHSGKILHAKNEHARMYPASMTKIMTALVALEYLNPDDVIVVGPEINGIPPAYATATHAEGESITVRTLLHVLLIRSGNEAGRIFALNVARVRQNRQNIPYDQAERIFCGMMNEKASELGALGTNFENPYGFHSENHYTTAYDLSLMCRALMQNELLAQIVGESSFTGDSMEGRNADGLKVRSYDFLNRNQLLQPGDNYYPYATGIKTGFTDDAGDCLAAAASKDGIELIAVIFDSKDPGRWQDAKYMFDFSFASFGYVAIHNEDDWILRAQISNPRLGDDGYVDACASEDAIRFLSHDELIRIERVIVYDEKFIPDDEDAPIGSLAAPISEGEILGAIEYRLDGEIIFEGKLYAANGVVERTYDSDMDYHIAEIQENIFTARAFPYWFGAAGFLFGIIGISAAVSSRRKLKREKWRAGPSYRSRGYYR